MRKTILLVFAILVSNLVVAQSSDLIFKGNIVGYYNQKGVPVVNVNLGYDDAQQFKSEHEVYIFAPGRVKPNNARPPQSNIGYPSNMEGSYYYQQVEHSSDVLRSAGNTKSIAIAVATGSGLLGGILAFEAPQSAAIVTLLGSITALVIDIIGNNQISKAARRMKFEEASQSHRIELLEKETLEFDSAQGVRRKNKIVQEDPISTNNAENINLAPDKSSIIRELLPIEQLNNLGVRIKDIASTPQSVTALTTEEREKFILLFKEYFRAFQVLQQKDNLKTNYLVITIEELGNYYGAYLSLL